MSELEMLAKLDDLERRVKALEDAQRKRVWSSKEGVRIEEMTMRYGEHVDKTQAAKILGITRATVYAMLADGRLEGACQGRRVTVASIARYMDAPKTPAPTKKGGCLNENPEPVD